MRGKLGIYSTEIIGFTGILDTITGAGMAFGVRKLRSAYSGSCMRVVRASDSTEQDIGFDGSGNLDTSAISTFCSGTTGYVGKWYDQSGTGIDASGLNYGTNTTSLPIIYESGAVVTLNSKPAIRFEHPRAFSWTTGSFSLGSLLTGGASKAMTCHIVGQQGSTPTQPWKVVIEDNTTGAEILWLYDDGSGERIEFITVASGLGGATFTDNAQKAWCYRVNDDTWNVYENATSLGSANVTASPTVTQSGLYVRIGGGSFSSRNLTGYMQECIIWPTVKTASDIFTDADTYYSIP